MLLPSTPVESLRGVGPNVARALARLGVRTAGDLLGYYPFRYEDYASIVPIARLRPGERATVRGTLELIGSRRSFRRRLTVTEAAIRDQTGYLKIAWFNQPYLAKMLQPGDVLMVSGLPEERNGSLSMASPSYEKAQAERTHTGRIIPIYSVTEGLTPRFLRTLVRQVLPLADLLTDPLPEDIRQREGLLNLPEAVRALHYPPSGQTLEAAKQRVAFGEVLRFQLDSLRTRAFVEASPSPRIAFRKIKTKRFVEQLPFQLTNAQRRSGWEILRDLDRTVPMNRLLQGDVGSGKTVVAALALMNAVWNGRQVAVMAPTELLAEQHARTFRELAGQTVPVALLTGSRADDGAKTTKRNLKERLAAGTIPVIIGTHALIEEDVRFRSLGLVIIDEQHRFGVHQRQRLRSKGSAEGKLLPHFLSMTATPIPRTLALTVYSDLDISTLNEMPPDRKPVITKLVTPGKRASMESFIRKQAAAGHQTFVITALIEESDALGDKAAVREYERLRKSVFPDLRIGLLHGRMASRAKDHAMRKFVSGGFDILVSTAVVEVGISAPNAAVMVIEDADRFGLAQLHQFRGRVSRSAAQAYCFVLSQRLQPGPAGQRLRLFARTSDGFAVAEADLKLRGPGELLGDMQSGLPDVAMSSLTDLALIQRARAAAKELVARDPKLLESPASGWKRTAIHPE